MYDFPKVISGIAEYIDSEILSKINDSRKGVIGSWFGGYLSKVFVLFYDIKDNKMIKSMNIIDKNNKINVDLLYTELKKQAKKSAITFDVPMIGPLTLNEADLDKLYQLITK